MYVTPQPSHSKDELVKLMTEIEGSLGSNANNYRFLRSIWKTHHFSSSINLDDQFDRLNKIVAMMKNHIQVNTRKQLYYQRVNNLEEFSVRENRFFENMNNAVMEKEDLETKYYLAQENNQKLVQQIRGLMEEISELKQQARDDARKIQALTKDKAQLENKILSNDYQETKSNGQRLRKSGVSSVNDISNEKPLSRCSSYISTRTILHDKNMNKIIPFHEQNNHSDSMLQSPQKDQLNESILSISNYSFIDQSSLIVESSQVGDLKQNIRNRQPRKDLLRNKNYKKSMIEQKNENLQDISTLSRFVRESSKKLRTRCHDKYINRLTSEVAQQ